MKTIFIILISFLFISGCQNIKYSHDSNLKLGDSLMSPGRANSPELPIVIGGEVCKDWKGTPGFCAIRWTEGKDFIFDIDAKPYEYSLRVKCADNVGYIYLHGRDEFSGSDRLGTNEFLLPAKINIPKNIAVKISVRDIKDFKRFQCSVSVYPKDRPESIWTSAIFAVELVDTNYLPREVIYSAQWKGKKYLVLGEHALYARADGHKLEKKTVIEGDYKKAYSESYNGRYNYYGL